MKNQISIQALCFLSLMCSGAGFVPDTPEKVDILADAIYMAEGAEKAKYPYGIISVSCLGEEACRRVCKNTIKNTFRRWDGKGDYLTYLSNIYAPIGAKNDPKGLNKNWERNVTFYLRRSTWQ